MPNMLAIGLGSATYSLQSRFGASSPANGRASAALKSNHGRVVRRRADGAFEMTGPGAEDTQLRSPRTPPHTCTNSVRNKGMHLN